MTDDAPRQDRDDTTAAEHADADTRGDDLDVAVPDDASQLFEDSSSGDHAVTAVDADATVDAAAPATAADEDDQGDRDDHDDHDDHDDQDDEVELDPEVRAAEDPRSPGQLLVQLEDAQRQRDEYLDALQRSRAEFDNFRRRSQREAAGARRAGVGDLASRLLDVLDDLDRTAEVAATSQDEGLAVGIGAVHRKLVDALVAAGLSRVDDEGVPFDANRHEAVQQVPADEPVDEPVVDQVLRPGYMLDDRCLRAAMVVVRQ